MDTHPKIRPVYIHREILAFALLAHGDPPARVGACTGVDSKPAKKTLETGMRYGRSGKPACWHVMGAQRN
jgi:hypothetical protein